MSATDSTKRQERVRDKVIDFLYREIVGPDPIPPDVQPNGEEILTGDPPRLRYGAGILFPRASGVDRSAVLLPDEVENASLEEPEEESTADGNDREDSHSAPEALDTIDETVSLANAYLPSALGISCLIELSSEGFILHVRAATYCAESVTHITESGEKRTRKRFLRIPLEFDVSLPSSALEATRILKPPIPVRRSDGTETGLQIRIISRPQETPLDEPTRRLLTVSLVNNRSAANEASLSEDCFFQVELELHASDGSAPFLKYPEPPDLHGEEEAESMALLYRHCGTYAIGHGCAAGWVEDCNGRAGVVRSEIMPVHEIHPIVPASFEDLSLRMHDLSDWHDEDNVIRVLTNLVNRYEGWIGDQVSNMENANFPEVHSQAARRHHMECMRCLDRMRTGIRLLEEDRLSLLAFRLTNRAMLLQQLHYALPLRTWETGEKGPLHLSSVVAWPNLDSPPSGKGNWYPFQLAFILMNLRSIADPECEDRKEVDLIWFPTGGGKTEAYLGLTAFVILLRRLRNPENTGTTVLMRYTLRLLTTQQFQRAATLICALELIRTERLDELGQSSLTIGLWVGSEVTPSKRIDATRALTVLTNGHTNKNPFILLKCPWCGAEMGPVRLKQKILIKGYERTANPASVIFRCEDRSCRYCQDPLPLQVIDEELYENPPALLIGTVDKFALLPWQPLARAFFGIDRSGVDPPDLIIQDELHLISGPLGSVVGHYETMIQEFCTNRKEKQKLGPKVVASTATISRAADQCHALYNCGIDRVLLFPPQFLRAGESFFAREAPELPGRKYVGIHASALSSHVTAQVRVLAALLQSALSVEVEDEGDRDPFWTLISYFNSLRELGHAATLIRADIREYLNAMWLRKGITKPEDGERDFRRFINRDLELTSRIQSSRIPESLQALELAYSPSRQDRPVDVCLASNMIAVGVDVPRLGLMTVTGQPKTTSEYIQATSRVGRRYPGLVVTIYNTGKPRDRSHYEHFHSYHGSIYRQVEPTSVTPFSAPIRERALHALLVGLVRYRGEGNLERPQPYPGEELLEWIKDLLSQRVQDVDPDELSGTLDLLEDRLKHWERVLPPRYGYFGPVQTELPLMYPAGSEPLEAWEGKSWPTLSSMRDVDATCEARVIGQYPSGKES